METDDDQMILDGTGSDEIDLDAIDDMQTAKDGIKSLFELLGRTYALDVLFEIVHSEDPIRFNELEAQVDIPSATLSKRLQELEEAGFVNRESHDEIPPRVEYEITVKTAELKPMFFDMLGWADTYSTSD